MSIVLVRLRQNYRVGFLRYLGRRDETALKTAIEEVQDNQAQPQDDQIREATAPYAPTTGL